MSLVGEITSPLSGAVAWLLDRRGALNVTKSHVGEMAEVVETALQHERWPSGADTQRWLDAWSRNGLVLARQMRSGAFADVERLFGFVGDFQRGLGPGERAFETTSQAAGDDRRFFERWQGALAKAQEALVMR